MVEVRPRPECRADDCDRPVYCKGCCRKHYARLWSKGTIGLSPKPVVPVRDRLLAFVQKDDATECWLWTGNKFHHGYGAIRADGRIRSAHRVSYELFVGPIPNDLELDHLCRVRACVNPEHLEPVTHSENMIRAYAVLPKTHCHHGHERTVGNTYITPQGQMNCRICVAGNRQRYNDRRRALFGALDGG